MRNKTNGGAGRNQGIIHWDMEWREYEEKARESGHTE